MTLDELTKAALIKLKITSILSTDDENTYLWQLNDKFADDLNEMRELNGKLRKLLSDNNIEHEY